MIYEALVDLRSSPRAWWDKKLTTFLAQRPSYITAVKTVFDAAVALLFLGYLSVHFSNLILLHTIPAYKYFIYLSWYSSGMKTITRISYPSSTFLERPGIDLLVLPHHFITAVRHRFRVIWCCVIVFFFAWNVPSHTCRLTFSSFMKRFITRKSNSRKPEWVSKLCQNRRKKTKRYVIRVPKPKEPWFRCLY